MTDKNKLTIVKTIHTLIWIFFNVVIFYMLYAVLINKIDIWLWIGYGLFMLEGLVLLLFKFFCHKLKISSSSGHLLYFFTHPSQNVCFSVTTGVFCIVIRLRNALLLNPLNKRNSMGEYAKINAKLRSGAALTKKRQKSSGYIPGR